jgi:hypothetical protein
MSETKFREVQLRSVHMVRYAVPLREGGSLPAIVAGDDGFDYVLKFKGAGQGARALIAELIGGEIARVIGLRVPELVFAHVDEAFGRTEPDEEIQDLLKASTGTNLALHYLSGSYTFDPVVTDVDADLASKIVWLDSFLLNVDRTRRNTNMLVWHKELWLIDHGAALYFHHNDPDYSGYVGRPFVQIKDHVLLRRASRLTEADAVLKKMISASLIRSIVGLIPDEWLESGTTSFEDQRAGYTDFLCRRLAASEVFVKAALDARNALI